MSGKIDRATDAAGSSALDAAGHRGWTWTTITKLFRFGVVAATSVGIYVVVTALLVAVLAIDARVASVLGYLAAMPFNFVAHRQYTFLSEGVIWREILRYCTAHAANILASVAVMALAVNVLGLSYWWGMAGTVVVVPLIQFLVMNLWVFRDQAGSRPVHRPRSET